MNSSNNENRPWLLETPKHVREGAMKDLADAYKVNFKLKSKNAHHKFDLKFRRKNEVQSIVIPHASIKEWSVDGVVFYPTVIGKEKVKFASTLKECFSKPDKDCRLSMDRGGRWVLHVPTQVPKYSLISKNHAERWCSLDPGVRTFMTLWSPHGHICKIGDSDPKECDTNWRKVNSATLYRRLVAMDKLDGRIHGAVSRSKRRMKKSLNRMRERHQNKMRDFHYQTANYLTKHYDHIIIPTFNSKDMSSRINRRLNCKTVRSMLGLGHYKFRCILKDVAERRGANVFECTEEYTSKTCSCCGWIHPKLGGSRLFSCQECGLKIDRDVQGAFNIWLKYFKEHPEICLNL